MKLRLDSLSKSVLDLFLIAACTFISHALSSAEAFALPISPSFALSASYEAPRAKQGSGDARTPLDPATADTRYANLRQMGIDYRQYNLWWSELEDKVASSPTPIDCPAGSLLIPASETERKKLGFNRFHCINTMALAKWDSLFARDQLNGMQTGIVVWSTPKFYRYAKCEGFAFGGNHLMDPCVPRDDAMGDFEDYFALLSTRYNGGALGKISHYIIWNENASDDWFDYTPVVGKRDLSKAGINKKIDKYADMLKRAHDVLVRHASGVMMYVSTDQLWEPRIHPGHMGTRVLLEGLWARLGTSISWSVAVHPYGDPSGLAPAGQYTFSNLGMVSDFQTQQLRSRGVATPNEYPQTHLIASEQGQPLNQGGRPGQARFICLAHDKAMKLSSLIAVAHNYFHSVEPQETLPGGESGQGAFFGLIPYTIPDSLEGYGKTETGQAYLSTSPDYWERTNSHYCCQEHRVGCKDTPSPRAPADKAIVGVFDGVFLSQNKAYVQGWACSRGQVRAIDVGVYSDSGPLIAQAKASELSEDAVRNECATTSGDFRFRIELTPDMRASYAGQSLIVKGLSPFTKRLVTLHQSGPFTVPKK